MRVLRAALVYFALVLAAGFALGTIRMLFVVPRMGTRAAELMEAPFMLTVTILAARFIVRRRLRDAKHGQKRAHLGLEALSGRFNGEGGAGATRTRPTKPFGRRDARNCAVLPPMEWPTRI